MTNTRYILSLAGGVTLCALAACKADSQAPGAAQAASPPAVLASPAPATAPAAAPAAAAVDFDKFALSRAALPAFPYAHYPEAVAAGLRRGSDHPLYDQTAVIVGDKLHIAEGRYFVIHFANEDAGLTAQQVQARYQGLIGDLGGVKVNTVGPNDPAFRAAHEQAGVALDNILRLDDGALGYEAYLIRTAAARAWIILMTNEETSRVVLIEEKKQPSSVRYIKQ